MFGSDGWLNGPEFLSHSESNWPCFPAEEQMDISGDDSETKKEAMGFATVLTKGLVLSSISLHGIALKGLLRRS